MDRTKDRTLLEELHKAICDYFAAENKFRRNPKERTWEARKDADFRITAVVSKVGMHLHGKKKDNGDIL